MSISALRFAGPVLTRRQAIAAGGLTGAALLVPLAAPAGAQAPAPALLADLPELFGTPSAVARRATKQVWAREADGTVLTWDKRTEVWTPYRQKWATVLTFGTAYLVRWSRPSGVELVMVMGTPKPAGPTTTSPPSTPPTTTTGPTTAPSSSAPTTSRPTGPPVPPPISPKPPQLVNTGFSVAPLGIAGGLLVAAGAGLQALRGRSARVRYEEGSSSPPGSFRDQDQTPG